MKNNDIRTIEQYRADMMAALRDNDSEKYTEAFEGMQQAIAADLRAEFDEKINGVRSAQDASIRVARGERILTSEEKDYYQKLTAAMKSDNFAQAVTGGNVIMPESIVNAVFDELETEHPLLSAINFQNVGAAVRILVNTGDAELATWGKLCDEIVKELTTGFSEIDTGLCKLSAFLPVCKAMLELGPQWLDRFVRTVLYEAYANGLEYGIITGTGKDMPIGMDRQVGAGVTVQDGVYPQKSLTPVTEFSPAAYGALLAQLAKTADNKDRIVKNLILVVNPGDYFTKIMPATTIQAPDGTYRNDILPYPTKIIQSAAVTSGTAILGLAHRYFAAVGVNGRIEHSDHYHFLEDERVYLIKGYANGQPLDNKAFLRLNVSNVVPALWTVKTVDAE